MEMDSEVVREDNVDSLIYNYIDAHVGDNYDDVVAQDGEWEVFFHLNEMRKALFNWYDFAADAELLEVGGGFGALTGMFCDKCRYVVTVEKSALRADAIKKRYCSKNNLSVICTDILNWKSEKKFDYIVMVGVLETICNGSKNNDDYAQVIRYLSGFLKPSGKMLIAVENRFGIRYFCGAVDKYTGNPYSGINHYPKGSRGYTFDKQQIRQIVENAGMKNCKFYYPLPDYVLPQLIFSEDYLPVSSLKERLLPYYVVKDHLVAYENDLYDDIVRNGAFEFMANSFLVECSAVATPSDIVYAALTTDRGEENGFATIIRKKGTVEKRALYEAGVTGLNKIYQNIKELQKRGISCVEHRLEDENRLVMPYVQEKTLCDELRTGIYMDVERFEMILDELYACILSSSDVVRSENNSLSHGEIENEKFGVILQKAYIDMVPINCFYIDNKFYFFDQEFVRRNYPAKYVLYRALKYTYFFIPEIEKFVPLQKLKEKYEMEDIWDCFEAEEKRFVSSNRNYEVYKYFLKWVGVNKRDIYKD